MWIERIRIDKFGGLRKVEQEFAPGLTVLLGGNESGKTTICAFIRAMLYGMNGKSASILQNERKKYMPWGETAMGGSLRVRKGNECYEIVRVFGQTKKSDSCRIVNVETGELVPLGAGQEPGEVLLGVEESVFADTLYVSCRGGKVCGGAELNARMRNRVETGSEETDLIHVQERLVSARNAIVPRIREKGALAQVRKELDEARRELMKEEALRGEIVRLQGMVRQVPKERFGALQKSLDENEARIREQEQALLMQEAQEKDRRAVAAIPAMLAVVTAVLSVELGIQLSAYAFAGLIAAAGLVVLAIVCARKQRRVRRERVDAVLGALSGLRQDQAMIKQQMALLCGGEDEEEALRTRLALEKAKQELVQLEEVKKRAKELEKQEEALLRDVEALEMALEAVRVAAAERREGIAPQLKREVEELLCGLTGARYEKAAIAEDFALSVQTEGGDMQAWEYFSGGTVEQMYLALRLGLIRQMEGMHGQLPVLLDDSLAQYDDERALDALELLHSFAAEGRQVLLLTCRKRDAQRADCVVRLERT